MIDFENLTKDALPKEFIDRIDRFSLLFLAGCGSTFEESELFYYEMNCIKQALSFYEYFSEVSDEDFTKLTTETPRLSDIIEKIKEDLPFFDEDHSGNSLTQSWQLFYCYRTKPELIPYMHGCLANLVGDRGYHDDRSDIPT